MKTIDKDFLLEQLNWRYSVKKFDATKKIREEDWSVLEEVLRLSPSSYGLQPWKFFVVQNPKIRQDLMKASYGQTQVQDCSHLVVLSSLKKIDETFVDKYMKKIADTRGVALSSLDGYKKNIMNTWVSGPRAAEFHHWTRRQVYIAMGGLLTTSALMGIDTTPMEGLDPAKYDEILNLKDTDFASVAAVACGYRHADDPLRTQKKVRFDKLDVIQTI